MSGSTRRHFLIATGAAGASVAVAGTADAAPSERVTATPSDAEPLVAHIADPSNGRISLYVGEEQIDITDRDLVGRIARAARRKA